MRTLIAIAPLTLVLGLLVAACGSSNTSENSCIDTGSVCLKSGAACGDTLPYACPSGGVCCSPTTSTASSQKIEPSAAPTATAH